MKVMIIGDCHCEGNVLAKMVASQGHFVFGHKGGFEKASMLWCGSDLDLCIYDEKTESDSVNWQWVFGMIVAKPMPFIVAAKELKPQIRDLSEYYVHLPKPASIESLKLALSDAMHKFHKKKEPLDVFQYTELPDRMFVKNQMNHYKLLMIEDILWAKGEGNYTCIVTEHENYLVRSFLGDFLRRMPMGYFARIHRSYVINLSAVVEIRHGNVLVKNTEIPMAKSYRSNLLMRFKTY